MKLIVGLGNPGDIYAHSRHNIGFLVIKALSNIYKAPLKRERGTFSLSARIKIDNQVVIIAMPLTFMNLSGNAVEALLKKHRIGLENLLMVLDDLDLDLARIKLRPSGSSAGHRGLESIIDSVDSSLFSRLRIGIGRSPRGVEASEYVLLPFSRKEKAQVKQAIEKATECCSAWVTKGVAETMNIFNKSASKALRTSTRSILSERSESKEMRRDE